MTASRCCRRPSRRPAERPEPREKTAEPVDRARFRYIRRTGAGSPASWHQPGQHRALALSAVPDARSWSTTRSSPATAGAARRRSACFCRLGALGFVLSVVSGLRYTRVSAEILFDMRRDLYEHLQRLSPRFYASTRLGDIVSRINNDIGEIQRVAAETALAWVGNVLFLAGSVAMLLWLDWRLFLVGMATLPPAAPGRSCVYRRRIEVRARLTCASGARDLGSFLIETLQGMRTVVTSGAERREVARFSRLNDAFIATLMGVQRMHYLAGGLPSLLIGAGTAAVFLLRRLARGRRHDDARHAGGVHGVSGARGRAGAGADGAVRRAGHGARVVAPGRRAARRDAGCGRAPDADRVARGSRRGRVRAMSRSRMAAAAPCSIASVSAPTAGATLAIVGASGSGKSTIADLLLRLLDPDAGVVRLDGHDLRSLRLADLRRHVQVVEQEPLLFHTSIEDNVRYARPDATDATVTRGARRRRPRGVCRRPARRPADHRRRPRPGAVGGRAAADRPGARVSRQPGGADARRAERGAGSRSPNDRSSTAIAAVMQRRTTIVISHRLELVRAADRVVVLDGARVVEAARRPNCTPAAAPFAALSGQPAPAASSSGARMAALTLSLSALAGRTGRGVRIAMIDSGVHAAHPHVGGIAGGAAFDDDGAIWPGTASDRLGHGTAVAAAIHEKAPDGRSARGQSLRSFARDDRPGARRGHSTGRPTQRVALINLSLGTTNHGHRDALARAVRPRRRRGCDRHRGGAGCRARLAAGRSRGRRAGRAGLGLRAGCLPRLDRGGRAGPHPGVGLPASDPGVPPERNVRGPSFAVANATGLLALAIEGMGARSIADLAAVLEHGARSPLSDDQFPGT